MKKKIKVAFLLLTSLLTVGCKKSDPNTTFKIIVDELVSTAENRYSINLTRAVYYVDDEKVLTYYVKFSVSNYYGIVLHHSLLGEFEKNEANYITHTGSNDIDTEKKAGIISEVERVFNIVPIDETGDYQGYVNLTYEEIYNTFHQSLVDYENRR